jgi:hypothetical protein
MSRILQHAAENLVKNHQLAQDDNLVAIALSLSSLMKEVNLDGSTRGFAMKE